MMWWKSSRPRHLPMSEGPYAPGCFDLMTDYTPEGFFIRLYYPTSLTTAQDHSSRWIKWMPDKKYLYGLAYFLNIWAILLKLFYLLYAGNLHIPVIWDAPLQSKGRKLPVIVFSHGLGGTRFFYSCTCIELASRGFVVAALEHRDNSASYTFYYKSAEHRRQLDPTWIQYKKIPLGGAVHHPARKQQVDYRAMECQKIVDMLEQLNAGEPIENVMGGEFALSQFKERLDLSNITMMGHSFGGATALRALGNDPRFRVGVVLDGWMFPVKDDADLLHKIDQPLIFVNTQTFQIPTNVAVMQKFTERSPAENIERLSYTIRSTTHENQADSPHILGYWLNWFMKKLDPVIATRINHHLILNFLHKHVGIPSGEVDEKFLLSQSHNVVQALFI